MRAGLKKAVFTAVAVVCVVSGLYVLVDRINTFFYGFEILFDEKSGEARVTDVWSGSAAEEAGLKVGDVVTFFNGRKLTSERDCIESLGYSHSIGSVELTITTDAGEKTVGITGRQSPLTIHSLVSFTIGAIYIILGWWVFFSRPQYRAANAWGYFSLLMGTVIFSGGAEIGTETVLGLVLKSIVILALIMSAAALLDFALVFPHPRGLALKRWTMPTLYGVAMLLVAILVMYLVANLVRGPLASLLEFFSPLLSMSTIFIWIGYLGLAVVVLLATYVRTGELEEKRRIRWITLGTAIPLGMIVLLGLAEYTPGLRGLIPMWLLPILLAAIPLTNFYAIVRHRAMQMEFIVRKGLIYTILTGVVLLTTAVVSAVVIGLLFLAQDLLPKPGEHQNALVAFLLDPTTQRAAIALWALVVGATLGRLKNRIQEFVDRRFYREKFNYRKEIKQLATVLDRTGDIEKMLEIVIENASRMVHPRSAATVLVGDGGRADVASAKPRALEGTSIGADAIAEMEQVFAGGRAYMGMSEMREERSGGDGLTRDTFVRLGADLCLPLRGPEACLGFLFLGPKLSEQEYSFEDIELLTLLADQAAHGVQHARLTAEVAEKQRIEHELQIGREIQRSLLPTSPPRLKGATLAAMSVPAMEVGGDFYTFIEFNPKRVGIVVGDIVGKGVAGAINMAATLASIRLIAEESSSVAETMQRLNRYLVRNTSARSFSALVFAVVDLEAMNIRWSSAGVPEPILLPVEGPARYLEMERYPLPPGASSRSAYMEAQRDLAPGDTIVFVTDGLIESRPQEGDGAEFGYRGLLAFLSTHNRDNPETLLKGLSEKLAQHHGSKLFDDDITAVALRLNGHR